MRGENRTGDDALIGGLTTTVDTGEFVIRALGDRGNGLNQELLSAAPPLRWLQWQPLLAICFLSCLSGGFPVSPLKLQRKAS